MKEEKLKVVKEALMHMKMQGNVDEKYFTETYAQKGWNLTDCVIQGTSVTKTIFTMVYISALDKKSGEILIAGTGISRKSHLDSFSAETGFSIAFGRAKKVFMIKASKLLNPDLKIDYRCNFAG